MSMDPQPQWNPRRWAGSLSRLGLVLAFLTLGRPALAQRPGVNQDESKVPAYTLPDPLALSGGGRVTDAATWNARRREILALFESQMYGKAPRRPQALSFEVTRIVKDALGGKATRKEVAILFAGKPDGPRMDLLVYIPNKGAGPFPSIVGLNFDGNHGVDPDPRIPLARGWVPNNPRSKVTDNKASDATRGSESSRWSLERAIDRGYSVATAYYGDIDPDFDDGFKNGVHALYNDPGKDSRPPDAWGSIAAWAWGLSRAMDYLETDRDINPKRIAVMGHSRLGKAALWAGATDPRFAVVISNDSGEGGAALSRRKFGETTRVINTAFPHWFCTNYKQYMDHEDALPFDQHMLLALVAPRPLLINSATEDLWADPRGEFLSAKGADPVYRLLGADGLGVRDMPGPSVLVWSTIGYHLRPGKHDVTDADWDAFMDFCDRHAPRAPAL